MQLSVVVVNWNSRDELRLCLKSLSEQSYSALDVLVVDNGSEDGSAAMVRAEFPAYRLLEERENLGFAEAANRGIGTSTGEWVALLNNDAVADSEWASALMRAAEEAPRSCGMLQSLMLFQLPKDVVNSTGIELTKTGGGRDRGEGKPRPNTGQALEDIFCPTGGAAAYRRVMLDAIRLPNGYFDAEHFMYSEDLDLGWRARLAGWSAVYVPTSVVHHRWHGSAHRHGDAWLFSISRLNRLRTLVKNGSVRFLLRTAPQSLLHAGELVWHGGLRDGQRLFDAVRSSLRFRRHVSSLATLSRRDLERAWVGR